MLSSQVRAKCLILGPGVPYLMMWLVSIMGSITTDLIISREVLATTTARKVANTIATVGPAMALLGEIHLKFDCF